MPKTVTLPQGRRVYKVLELTETDKQKLDSGTVPTIEGITQTRLVLPGREIKSTILTGSPEAVVNQRNAFHRR